MAHDDPKQMLQRQCSENSDSPEECCICLEQFSDRETYVHCARCGKFIHAACVDRLNKCPLCNASWWNENCPRIVSPTGRGKDGDGVCVALLSWLGCFRVAQYE